MRLARGLQSEQTRHCWVLWRAHPWGRDTPTASAAPSVSPVVLLECPAFLGSEAHGLVCNCYPGDSEMSGPRLQSGRHFHFINIIALL